ncbi:uncharacterized protein LOC120278445 [Dioscorea cayenensis subsp. rotundata]|uniref:Uncharacterized protein LOC120278445 n=1 Tax=Dioscorea cayennensis subsp. rotundata TaxID=55577 RepID=A0AB40CMF5_DIOCR|nr:uncharacterized protein LOC120278445 [Dioscorea cayenensis subsp. rotundata]
MQATHICGGGIGVTAHPKASKKWVSERVMQKLKEIPLYKVVDIQKDILRDHGVCLPYKRAWMGKEVARVQARCRPLLFIDGTLLLAKYGGILLGATAKDGNEGLFHVAFAIIDNETDENCTWFLATLGDALYADVHGWLMNKSDVDHWSNYLFKGMRWCEIYSNVVESFNAWIKEAQHLPVKIMVDSIRFKLMNMLAERREQCNNWGTHLCPEIRKKVEQIVDESRFLRVGLSTDETYEVIDNNNNAVSLQSRSCSCRRWEVHGLPCKHACVAIMQTDTNIHFYVADYFTMEWYRRTYVNPISPVPGSDKPSDDNRPLRLRPPISKKWPGHPRRKLIESQAFDVYELHCSRCHEAGHNRQSCNAVIAD